MRLAPAQRHPPIPFGVPPDDPAPSRRAARASWPGGGGVRHQRGGRTPAARRLGELSSESLAGCGRRGDTRRRRQATTRRWRRGKKEFMFERGTLWDSVRSVTASALQTRALDPIDTDFDVMDDRGVRFVVRVVTKLRHKPRVPDVRNPFLPYEAALYVADALPTHVCLLNKYNVLEHHLLIITRCFEDQEDLLSLNDFRALWRCLSEYDSLGFYNSGTLSGASQRHKHLQVVPLPLHPKGGMPAVPIDALLAGCGIVDGEVLSTGVLPFRHVLAFWGRHRMATPERAAHESLARYHDMLRRAGMWSTEGGSARLRGAYNLLVTRRWMMLVPRVRECFHSMSFNSLAFAGALLVQTKTQLAQLRAAGPFAALEHVTWPDVAGGPAQT